MTTTPRTLTQMQNRATSYEVAVTAHCNTTRLGFTERKTRAVLLWMAHTYAGAQMGLLTICDWDGKAIYSKGQGWVFGPVRIHFTGRTERDVASEMGRI